MSDQSLRDALESQAKAWKHERGDLYYASQELMGMLAAHPARPAPVFDREALEKLAARYEDLAGPEREFDENSIMSLREEARTGAYRLAARELRALLNGTAK